MTVRPYAPRFAEHYWSPAGGLREKQEVFVVGSRLPQRLLQLSAHASFTVAELGFGTGLNWALTAALFARLAPPESALHYVSYEAYPLPEAELATIHTALPADLQPWLVPVQQSWADLRPGWNRLAVGSATLHLWVGEAFQGLTTQPHRADAWYLDGFSPAKNPDLWSLPLMVQVAAQSQPEATVATYSVARLVRDNLAAVGFGVEKVAGVPPKRDRLEGRFKA